MKLKDLPAHVRAKARAQLPPRRRKTDAEKAVEAAPERQRAGHLASKVADLSERISRAVLAANPVPPEAA